jgi:hypothetical protein
MGMKTHVMMPRIPSSRTVLVLLFLAATAFGLLGMNLRPAHALSLYSVNQTKSGLVGSDPLTAQLSQAQLATSSYWFFGGDAIAQKSPYAFSEDASGLHIGVQATPVAPFAGFYAVHKDNAMVAHAVLTSPSRTVPSGYPNVGLYVQTGGPNVNYAVCAATTSSAQTFWSVALAIGNPNTAFQYIPLYVDSSANQPLTRDCTIVTNGQNYLAVYFDGTQVYQSSSQNLGYQMPFLFFLETQTSYTGAMFTGTFSDFYLASSDNVTVTNMPANSVAQIVSATGQVLASSPADGSGTATMPIGKYHMPLVANIQVTQLGLVVGSTSSPVSIWGGNSYSLSLSLGLAGGLTGAAPSSSGASVSVAAPAPAAVAPAVGAVQSTTAPTLAGAVTSAAPKAAAGQVAAASTAPLTALSLIAALGGSTPRRSPLGQEEPR